MYGLNQIQPGEMVNYRVELKVWLQSNLRVEGVRVEHVYLLLRRRRALRLPRGVHVPHRCPEPGGVICPAEGAEEQ